MKTFSVPAPPPSVVIIVNVVSLQGFIVEAGLADSNLEKLYLAGFLRHGFLIKRTFTFLLPSCLGFDFFLVPLNGFSLKHFYFPPRPQDYTRTERSVINLKLLSVCRVVSNFRNETFFKPGMTAEAIFCEQTSNLLWNWTGKRRAILGCFQGHLESAGY